MRFLISPYRPIGVLIILLSVAIGSFAQDHFEYPESKKGTQVDDYHGTKVADPYRWLEDADSADTKSWVAAQNKVTFGYLKTIKQRESIKTRLTELWNYEKFSAPFKRGGKYFYYKNDGLQNQSVLYIADSVTDTGRVLLDPNKFSKDGTDSMAGLSISEDDKIAAYGVSKGGSDWREWYFVNIATGEKLPDLLKHIKFSGMSWTRDGKGVYYSRYPKPDEKTKLADTVFNQKLYFHKIGTGQEDDKPVYVRREDPKLGINGFATDDGKWLLVYLWKGTSEKNQVYYKDLTAEHYAILPLTPAFENSYSFVGNIDTRFFFVTDKNAPLRKLVSVDVAEKRKVWRDVISEAAETLRGVSLINDKFVANYLKDAYSKIKVFDAKGEFIRDVKLPGIGTAAGYRGRRKDKETFYSYQSFNAAPTIYRYNMETGESTVFRKPAVKFDPDNYEVKQVFYSSKDGTRVPMFIVHRKGIALDGNNPTLLYGYGGFNISITPGFSVSRLTWMDMGGVLAIANLRGGGEYGEKWHEAGTKLKKQNVFDDFIAGAEWLIANKYTRPQKLAIQGGSNGGLLVGAVLNQ